MELTTTIVCTLRVSATLGEGQPAMVKVFGIADYAEGRSTTAELAHPEIPPELVVRVEEALQAVLAYAEGQMGPRIAKAIAKSAEVAASHGEI